LSFTKYETEILFQLTSEIATLHPFNSFSLAPAAVSQIQDAELSSFVEQITACFIAD